MSVNANESNSARFLRYRPELRQHIQNLPQFQKWLESFKKLVLDDKELYIVGGDMFKDQDEMILDWARMNGLVQQEEVDFFFRDNNP
jgi:hypothetical protein